MEITGVSGMCSHSLTQFSPHGVTLFSLFKLKVCYRISWILSGPVIPFYYILSTNLLLMCVCWFHCNTSVYHTLTVSPARNIFFYPWIPKSFLSKLANIYVIWLSFFLFASILPAIQLSNSSIQLFIHLDIQGVTGGKDQTSGRCSLC